MHPSALALRQLFYVEGEVLKKVETFCYLGRILAQDDDDVRAVRSQIKKARVIWAQVGQVLQVDNTPPKVSTKFYKAVVQSVLFYGSETWNLTTTALAWLERFHIRATYRVAKKHRPWKGPNHVWVYPATDAPYLALYWRQAGDNFSLYGRLEIHALCTVGEQRRGLAPRKWWWEQKICLGDEDADGAGE